MAANTLTKSMPPTTPLQLRFIQENVKSLGSGTFMNNPTTGDAHMIAINNSGEIIGKITRCTKGTPIEMPRWVNTKLTASAKT